MTDQQRADRLFLTWLESEAPTATPDGLLDRIDTATRPVRPRPAWVARLEGHHMDVFEGGRRSGVPRLSLALVIIAVLAAAVAVAAFIASQQDPSVVVPSVPPDASPSLTAEISPEPSLEPSLEPTPARIVSAGSLIEGRSLHAATILADGRVLITGGQGASESSIRNYLTSTEIWDPLTNTTTASGSTDPDVDYLLRTTQNALLLPDGRVFIVPGGCFCRGMPTAPAEIWDPNSGTWRAIETLTITRTGHSATLLSDGRILIAGGGSPPFDGGPAAADAFIWDPVRETSTPTGSMATGRGYHTATRLADGRVLVVGGSSGGPEDMVSGAEVWDPASGSFSDVPSLAGVRAVPGLGIGGTAVALHDGRVLIVGGSGAVLWDPRGDTVTDAGSLSQPRQAYTVTLLADGRVLMIGGYKLLEADAPVEPILEAELWDPATLTFEVAGSLSLPRQSHTTTALLDDRALIVGGTSGSYPAFTGLQEIEVWEPPRG